MIRKVYVGGHCMGPDFGPCVAMVDDEAEIFAGDFVLAHFRLGDETFSIVKQVETWDGKWFLWARTGVTLLAGHQLTLAHIERVTSMTKLPAHALPNLDAACYASLEDMRIQDEFSREARKGWNEHGFPRGIPFPGLEALYPYRGPERLMTEDCRTRLHASAVIPTSNPTSPDVPRNVSIRSINGTLEFSWDAPITFPRWTRYEIFSSVNCGDVTTGTKRWEGDTHRAILPFLQADISSGSFYWVRAISNSYASAYVPNTFGTPAAFTPPAETRTIISDPQFRQGQSIGSYWIPSGGLPVSLSATGGPSDGTGRLTIVGTTQYAGSPWNRTVFCARNVSPNGNDIFAPCIPGQWLNWAVTWRRTTGVTSGGGFIVFGTNRYIVAGANVDLDIGTTLIRCDTVTVNAWQTAVGSMQMSALLPYNSIAPQLKFDSSNLGSGTLEISGFDAILR